MASETKFSIGDLFEPAIELYDHFSTSLYLIDYYTNDSKKVDITKGQSFMILLSIKKDINNVEHCTILNTGTNAVFVARTEWLQAYFKLVE